MIRSLFDSDDPNEEAPASREDRSVSDAPRAPETLTPPSPAIATHETRESKVDADSPESARSQGIEPEDDFILDLEPPAEQPEDLRKLEEKLAAVERELAEAREISRRGISSGPDAAGPLQSEDRSDTPIFSAFDRTHRDALERSPIDTGEAESTIDRIGQPTETIKHGDFAAGSADAAETDSDSSARNPQQFTWTPNVPTILDSGPAAATDENPDYEPVSKVEAIRQSGLALTAATVLFGSIAFLLIIGWFADLLLDTSPWGKVCGIVIGSAIGFIQFFRLTSEIFKK